MYKGIVIFVVALVAIATLGCTSPPKPPASDIPLVVIDYNGTLENHTLLYVRGLENTRYDSINLIINDKELVYNNSFSLEYHTNLDYFGLEIKIWLDNNFYYHNASYRLTLTENIVYEVMYPDERIKEIQYIDLPFAERFTKVVVDGDG